ncbi:MAG: hypothetical protein AABY53_00310 [Bdellovibrionota bacterium]
MKLLCLFILVLSNIALAQHNSADEIICTNSENSAKFSINTNTGKILFNNTYKVHAPVFSGINSPQDYIGEVVAEIEIEGIGYYLTLIMRETNNKPQLEAIWFDKRYHQELNRYFLNNCSK